MDRYETIAHSKIRPSIQLVVDWFDDPSKWIKYCHGFIFDVRRPRGRPIAKVDSLISFAGVRCTDLPTAVSTACRIVHSDLSKDVEWYRQRTFDFMQDLYWPTIGLVSLNDRPDQSFAGIKRFLTEVQKQARST